MKKNKADQAENIRQQKALRIAELQDQIEQKRIDNSLAKSSKEAWPKSSKEGISKQTERSEHT